MSTQFKLRRGTTAQHSTFTGASGEVTVDTTKNTMVVHDNTTAGGIPLATEDSVTSLSTSTAAALADKLDSSAGAVGSASLASNAVTTVKIADANVTTAKIADANVTTAKIAAGAATLAKLDTTGAAGRVLTSKGAGVAPSWDLPSAGTQTLLGTLTTTSGTTQTLSSLDLTSYDYLECWLNSVSFTGTVTPTLAGQALTLTNTAATLGFTGKVVVDLSTGVYTAGLGMVALTGNGSGNLDGKVGRNGITNATTSITFAGGTFDGGSIRVYGVK